MKGVELYGRVRHAVQIEGLSHREAARRFGVDPRTVRKMMMFSVPPGYRRSKLAARPKLDPFVGIIDRIQDPSSVHKVPYVRYTKLNLRPHSFQKKHRSDTEPSAVLAGVPKTILSERYSRKVL